VLERIRLTDKLASFDEQWRPKIVAELNDLHVKVVKVQGEFVWHHHDDEDELFLVISGRLTIRTRDGEVELEPGDLTVVPRGVEHCPFAADEAHVVIIERATTVNTGTAGGDRTVVPEWI
jgi:mannose-6-phosphate isomerase-like protein (cupin superfamily)